VGSVIKATTIRRLGVGALVAGLISASCTPSPEVVFFNNTGATLVVAGAGKTCVVKPGAHCRIPFSELMRVRTGRIEVEYAFPGGMRYEDRKEWVDFQPVSRRIFKVQIENDERVFLLAAAARAVGSPPQPQREGFPLLPKRRYETTPSAAT
jgi:hypothetical protein